VLSGGDRRQVHRVAVYPGQRHRRLAVPLEHSHGIVDLLAQLREFSRIARQPLQVLRFQEIARAAPAELHREAPVYPLKVAEARQDGVDVVLERDAVRQRHRACLDESIVEQVVNRAHADHIGGVVGRAHDHPGRLHRDVLPVDRDRGRHGAVGNVVLPAVVVGEGGYRPAAGRGGLAAAAQEDQPSLLVGAQLPQVDRFTEELATVESVLVARLVRPLDRARAGVDCQAGAVGPRHTLVSELGLLGRRRFRYVEGDLELVPRAFGVCHVDGPANVGPVGC
jgi:hypothetical protein